MAQSEAPTRRCAREALPAGTWDRAGLVDEVLLDFDQRHRRRSVMTAESGAEVLIDLSQAMRLREGDGLRLDEGGIVAVRARAEKLLEIRTHSPAELARIAWHLGNRHLPVQILGDRVRFREDHVIAEMVRGLGGHVSAVDAPFDPEGGAYGGSGGRHHNHHHGEQD